MIVTAVTACHMGSCDAIQAHIYWGNPYFSLSVTPSLDQEHKSKRTTPCDSVTTVTNVTDAGRPE